MEHELKCWPRFFQALVEGRKSFEIRKKDRPQPFNLGDMLVIKEYDPDLDSYSGRVIRTKVIYLVDGEPFLPAGLCVMGLGMEWLNKPAPSASVDENGEPLFYIQDTRTYVGNSVLWWGPDGRGYTTKINEAGKYTLARASDRKTDRLWPCDYVDQFWESHVDMQKLNPEKAVPRSP